MADLAELSQITSIATAVGTLALVVLFWMALKHMEETTKLSKIQLTHRFRPWVGPVTGIEQMSEADGRKQFAISLKNYGEIPTSNMIAMFSTKNELPKKESVKTGNGATSFNLGPLLPNMEKRYWFFVESDQIQKAKKGETQIYITLYFSYDHLEGKSGYGMISEFDSKTDMFVHKEMWVD
jgi:hypothetical protein